MARTVGDLRILFEVLHGPDSGDALTFADANSRTTDLRVSKRSRIGILEDDALGRVTPETQLARSPRCTASRL